MSLEQLGQIIEQYRSKPILICSDTNVRNMAWNDRLTNDRGRKLEEFLHSNRLIVASEDQDPTFAAATPGELLIDLIICNSLMHWCLGRCRTLADTETLLDH